MAAPDYAELHAISNFSFQRGASHPHELVARAHALGYRALALTDECSVAGVVKAHLAAKACGLQLLLGAEFLVEAAQAGAPAMDCRIVVIARTLEGWGNLCEFISTARRDAPKGQYQVHWPNSHWGLLRECEVVIAPCRHDADGMAIGINLIAARAMLRRARGLFDAEGVWLAAELLRAPDDDLWRSILQQLSAQTGVPLVAAGDVHMHVRARKPLQDVLTAVRRGTPVSACGLALQPNAERHLRPRHQLAALYPADWLANTLVIAQRCHFSLDEVRYNYPQEAVPPGCTPLQGLSQLTWAGAAERYPQGVPAQVEAWLHKELALIAECQYEMYFLTVHDIVRFARSRHILCQGRGSAANSVVCFCLGITAADPMFSHPLLERFISLDRRNEPPDIDVDFEHERREEVIQYLYAKYGRERAAIAAVVICWRPRSALRDAGKALEIPEVLIAALAKEHPGMYSREVLTERLQVAIERVQSESIAGFIPPADVRLALWLDLATQLQNFPRHLSQHVGGFVLTQTPLVRLVPVENAAMKDRSIIQWDKDDLEQLGLMKVDVLALGMLTALRRCVDLVAQRRGTPFSVYDIPQEDPATYAMVRRADTVGVFQIESRAQMSMLPRLRPTTFYDLVVQVAIVRPGPISGGMVHPYLQARKQRVRGEAITYERSSLESTDQAPRLQKALERTLGIPIFQEQVMEISMIAAGFSATESDSLRRAMAAWKKEGDLRGFEDKLVGGMLRNGYSQDFADRIFAQIKGFGEYGFPESHAYSFALLAYLSSWLKCHEPVCFLAALLNSLPMGFYSASQLVQDAQRHGVQVLPVDVTRSDWDCTLEPIDRSAEGRSGFDEAVRLGLCRVQGLGEAAAVRIVAARAHAPFANTDDLARRAGLGTADIKALAAADALSRLAGHRRQQVWDAAAWQPEAALLHDAPVQEAPLQLPAAPEGEEIVFDYAATGLTLRRHPLALLRPRLTAMRLQTAQQLQQLAHGRLAAACGLVSVRQRPQTANGTMFVTLEDETGNVNVIVWPATVAAQRIPLMRARLLAVRGIWQRDEESESESGSGGQVCHLIAGALTDLTPLLGRLAGEGTASRDFR
ncbi:MAG: error-prone DNA polymerase [Rhodoferax sp.]|nr:error-prone DNA polymerase [Rhodoferax sp.]